MNWKRVLRVAVCLVLVCALVVGVSPIKAKATAIAFSSSVGFGALMLSLLYSAGFTVSLVDTIMLEDLGDQVMEYMQNEVDYSDHHDADGDGDHDDEDEKYVENMSDEELKTYLKEVADKAAADAAKLGSTIAQATDTPINWSSVAEDFGFAGLGSGLVWGMSNYIESLCQDGFFSLSSPVVAATGWSYYGDYYLPTFPTYEDYPYMVLRVDTIYDYEMMYSTAPFYLRLGSSGSVIWYTAVDCYHFIHYTFDYKIDDWNITSSYSTTSVDSYCAGDSLQSNELGVWSNHDVLSWSDGYTVLLSGSSASSESRQVSAVYPDLILPNSAASGVIAGGVAAADIPDLSFPETVDLSAVFSGVETGGTATLISNFNTISESLSNGTITLAEYQQSITYSDSGDSEEGDSTGDDVTDPTEDPSPTEDNPDSGDSSEDGTQDDTQVDGTLANFPVLNFFSRLGQLLQDLQDGTLEGFQDFLNPHFESQNQVLTDIFEEQQESNSVVNQGFQDVLQQGQEMIDSMKDILNQQEQQDQLDQQIQQEQNNILEQGFSQIGEAVTNGLTTAFVPSEGFIDSKLDELTDNYSFAASIADTGKDLKNFLVSLGSTPPVIRINLGANTTGYNYGGEMVLIDFSFYEPYKASMDAVLSAFLWLWFCWRVVLNLPGIISGASGVAGSFVHASEVGSRGYIELSQNSAGQAASASKLVPESVRSRRRRNE